jgi:uncharacterized RDD family membrane protein YckC
VIPVSEGSSLTNPYAPPTAAVADVVAIEQDIVPAGRGVRLGATLLDNIVLSAMTYVPFFAGNIFFTGSGADVGAAVGVLLGCVGFGIWAWFTVKYVRANGQSFGKRALHIKVLRSDGSAVSLGRIFWRRNLLNIVLTVIPFVGAIYGLADALFIFTESRKCLHDRLADTIVVLA